MSKLDGPDWDCGMSTIKLWKNMGVRDDVVFAKLIASRAPLVAAALAWRDAAVADGWACEPTYEHESVDTAFTLKRDGWEAHGLARPADGKTAGCGAVSVWAPDKLQVRSGRVYGWAALQAEVRTCGYCRQADVSTSRVGFAGRCCAACMPTIKPRVEFAGWTS